MKRFILFSLLFLNLLVWTGRSYAQLLVVDNSAPFNDPLFLVEQVLLDTGVTVSNVTFNGLPGIPTGANATMIGFFDGSGSNIGIRIDGADTNAIWIGAGSAVTTAADGITFGSGKDVNLYRSGADTLTTDANFVVGANINPANLPTSSGSLNSGDLWVDQADGYALRVTPG